MEREKEKGEEEGEEEEENKKLAQVFTCLKVSYHGVNFLKCQLEK